MKPSKVIKYKSLFLLVSFSLNSVVGFGCSLGLDRGFNSKHHQRSDDEQPEYSHKDHPGAHGNDHNTFILKAEDENCCNDFVVGYQNLDQQVFEKSYGAKAKIAVTPFIQQQAPLFKNTGYARSVRTLPELLDYSHQALLFFFSLSSFDFEFNANAKLLHRLPDKGDTALSLWILLPALSFLWLSVFRF